MKKRLILELKKNNEVIMFHYAHNTRECFMSILKKTKKYGINKCNIIMNGKKTHDNINFNVNKIFDKLFA